MKVLLLADYFYPYNPGGTEWSVYELAKLLKKNKIDAKIVTLNYGAKDKETLDGIEIIRLPFPKRLNDRRKVVNPIWQNNPIFFATSAFQIFKIIKSENPDVIHVHGKFLIPGAIIAGFFTKKPVIATIRDKQIFCPIGRCFFDTKRYKACNFWLYLLSDFPWFIENYTNKNPFAITYALFGVTWSRLAGNIIKFFAERATLVTTISISQKKYLKANGFKDVKVIYNTANFQRPKATRSKIKSVLFVGKLSKGKGIEVLLDAAKSLLKSHKIMFVFAGSLRFPKIKNVLEEKSLRSHIKLLGSVNYKNLPSVYRKASVVVMPSIYPESFGRVALEALSFGTPVVVTNIGALPEIIQNRITGRIVRPDARDLSRAILEILKNENVYIRNIRKEYPNLKKIFFEQPTRQILELYRSLAGSSK